MLDSKQSALTLNSGLYTNREEKEPANYASDNYFAGNGSDRKVKMKFMPATLAQASTEPIG